MVELPNHLDDCPVKTGRTVGPEENYTARAHDQLMERLSTGQQAGSAYHAALYQARLELRIERLEKELALLAARVAKLERAEQPPY